MNVDVKMKMGRGETKGEYVGGPAHTQTHTHTQTQTQYGKGRRTIVRGRSERNEPTRAENGRRHEGPRKDGKIGRISVAGNGAKTPQRRNTAHRVTKTNAKRRKWVGRECATANEESSANDRVDRTQSDDPENGIRQLNGGSRHAKTWKTEDHQEHTHAPGPEQPDRVHPPTDRSQTIPHAAPKQQANETRGSRKRKEGRIKNKETTSEREKKSKHARHGARRWG
ncbi:hypothetical protein AB1N83_014107 [Pleurotus pulmonarius]